MLFSRFSMTCYYIFMPPLNNRFQRRPMPVVAPRPPMNHQITAPELRVIGEKGENLGVMAREDAIKLTRPEEGMDLILISPNAKPPVARVMSYDKFRYEEGKREKKERAGPESDRDETRADHGPCGAE